MSEYKIKTKQSILGRIGHVIGSIVGVVSSAVTSPKKTVKFVKKKAKNGWNGITFGYDTIIDEIDNENKKDE